MKPLRRVFDFAEMTRRVDIVDFEFDDGDEVAEAEEALRVGEASEGQDES